MDVEVGRKRTATKEDLEESSLSSPTIISPQAGPGRTSDGRRVGLFRWGGVGYGLVVEKGEDEGAWEAGCEAEVGLEVVFQSDRYGFRWVRSVSISGPTPIIRPHRPPPPTSS